MPNLKLVQQGKQMTEDKEILKQAYHDVGGHVALKDIIRECEERYDAEVFSAIMETDNPHKSATALQRASAYANIKAYILDMLDVSSQ